VEGCAHQEFSVQDVRLFYLKTTPAVGSDLDKVKGWFTFPILPSHLDERAVPEALQVRPVA
jgi:hypothetical protein